MSHWTFEPGHTAAEFCARHMMISYVRGSFKDVHGTLDFDPSTPERSRLQVTINAADERDARDRVEEMCHRLLANHVIEDFRFELHDHPDGHPRR